MTLVCFLHVSLTKPTATYKLLPALRRVMLRAHRQAWAWQDEWIGLNMDDIRALEKETQELLAKKMARKDSITGKDIQKCMELSLKLISKQKQNQNNHHQTIKWKIVSRREVAQMMSLSMQKDQKSEQLRIARTNKRPCQFHLSSCIFNKE